MNEGIINYVESFYVFVGDLLMLDELPELSLNDSIDTACAFSNGKILVNLNLFPKENVMFIFMALAHELRHAYQIQCLQNEELDYFEEEELDIIQTELSNYIPHGQDYKNQLIELDAFGFAEFIMNVAFSIRSTYNESFSKEEIEKIYDVANKFKTFYQPDEIEECMNYAGFKPIKKDYC